MYNINKIVKLTTLWLIMLIVLQPQVKADIYKPISGLDYYVQYEGNDYANDFELYGFNITQSTTSLQFNVVYIDPLNSNGRASGMDIYDTVTGVKISSGLSQTASTLVRSSIVNARRLRVEITYSGTGYTNNTKILTRYIYIYNYARPTATITADNIWTNTSILVNVSITGPFAIKSILSGNDMYFNVTTFPIKKNGTSSVTVTDINGKQSYADTVSVSTIDKNKPSVNLTLN